MNGTQDNDLQESEDYLRGLEPARSDSVFWLAMAAVFLGLLITMAVRVL